MTEAAFDGVAQGYDQVFSHSETGLRQRRQVQTYLRSLLSRPMRVLELNCGTGEDAAWLAGLGHSVLATDLSAEMIRTASRKTPPRQGLAFQQADIRAALSSANGNYDLIFSNFGGFNCLSPAELQTLGPLIQKALAPGGHFVGVVMPRFCTWETLYFLAKMRPGQAFRRATSKAVPVQLDAGHSQPTWYYGPKQLRKAFGKGLQLHARRPIGSFLPPSYLDPFFARRPRLLARMDRLEQRTANWSWLSGTSDHCLVDFTHAETSA